MKWTVRFSLSISFFGVLCRELKVQDKGVHTARRSTIHSVKRISVVIYALPRVRDILFLLVFAVSLASGWRTLNSDGDLPRHLLLGQVIVESHSIPRQEATRWTAKSRNPR